MKSLSILASVLLLATNLCCTTAMAAAKGEHTPSAKDKCPVCGMFVAKYPDWTAVARGKDGHNLYFDGPKDLFTYYLDSDRYTAGKKQGDITALFVKEYYGLKTVDAKTAFFVVGSDVHGPMGAELIPFATQKDATSFFKDHHGKKIIRFVDITRQTLKELK